jgi:hypothetical protein
MIMYSFGRYLPQTVHDHEKGLRGAGPSGGAEGAEADGYGHRAELG